jgi:2Fe-2S ferredoxin
VITIIGRNGESRSVEARDGWSLMEIIRDAGVQGAFAICGGACACATCHVYIESDRVLSSKTADESDLLEFSAHARENSRLSCQIRLSPTPGDITVRVAPEE